MRFVSSQASPPIGCPAVKSSNDGASVSNMMAASWVPCGSTRFAVGEASGNCMLLASQSWSSASVSCEGGAILAAAGGSGDALACVLASAGLSQSRGSSCTATSTPASRHQANALRASAQENPAPVDCTSPPTAPFLTAIDDMVKEAAGQMSRNVWTARREEDERP